MNENMLNLRCNCGEEWTEKVAFPLTHKEWLRMRDSIRCPACDFHVNITEARPEAA